MMNALPEHATIARPAAPPARVRPHHPTLPLRVGTRASPLALAQTRSFLAMLTRFCPVLRGMDVFCEHAIQTTGDKVLDRPLAEIGGKGLFAKEIHQALQEGRIDFAVHSLKDLETTLPDGISLACVLKREDPRDVFILNQDLPIPRSANPYDALPHGAVVGTCSVRRAAQLLAARPDVRITTMRGNVQSRLAKVREGQCAASLLALAGLNRLGLQAEASVIIPAEIMVPAACQGIVGITVRSEDQEVIELLRAIEDGEARICATAERALQQTLDGTCATPIGAFAQLVGGWLTLTGMVASPDGTFVLRRRIQGAAADAPLWADRVERGVRCHAGLLPFGRTRRIGREPQVEFERIDDVVDDGIVWPIARHHREIGALVDRIARFHQSAKRALGISAAQERPMRSAPDPAPQHVEVRLEPDRQRAGGDPGRVASLI